MLTLLIHDYKSIITGHYFIHAWIYVFSREVYCLWRIQGTVSSNFQLHEEFKVARLPESKRFRIKQIILLFKLPISCFLHDSIVL